jgi:hypothetical protein
MAFCRRIEEELGQNIQAAPNPYMRPQFGMRENPMQKELDLTASAMESIRHSDRVEPSNPNGGQRTEEKELRRLNAYIGQLTSQLKAALERIAELEKFIGDASRRISAQETLQFNYLLTVDHISQMIEELRQSSQAYSI